MPFLIVKGAGGSTITITITKTKTITEINFYVRAALVRLAL
jgi:hypothetical protein